MFDLSRRTAVSALAAGLTLPNGLAKAAGRQPLALRYADAWSRRSLPDILACMSPSVQFIAPNASTTGLQEYAASTARFLSLVRAVKVRACIQSKSQVMLAYDFTCVDPIGVSAVAELLHIRDGKIERSEIFFDTAPFARFAQQHAAKPSAQ